MLPRPQTSRLMRGVRLAALSLSAASIASLVTVGWYGYRETVQVELARVELMARVLEDHATRSIESADLILHTLAEGVDLQQRAEAGQLQPLLTQALRAQPTLRGIAVLHADGRVLASSEPREQGLRLDMSLLGPLPPPDQSTLLPLLPGRNLHSLGAPALTGHVSMLPLLRRTANAEGSEVLLLALINPDALANFQHITLGDLEGTRAALLSYQGQLLAGTDSVTKPLGSWLPDLSVFQEFLPRREVGAYVGPGIGIGTQMVAFRASRNRPLIVLVERDRKAALSSWFDEIGILVGVGLLAQLVIVGVGQTVLRTLRVREQARGELDHAHEKIARSERELSVLLKSVQELIFRTDAEGRLTFVNARDDAFDPGRLDGALGLPLRELVVPEDSDRVARLFSADDAVGLRSAEVSVRREDGQLRHFQLAISPLLGKDRPLGFAGSAVDVTERRHAEQRLQRQLEFTELLLEVSPQPISMFDAQGRYVLVNRAWEELIGRDRRKVIGREVGFFLAPEDRVVHDTQDAHLRVHGGRVRYEAGMLDRFGRFRDMLVTKVAVPDAQNGAVGILCTVNDVSEFRAAERATREARDAAEEASSAKSEFIANISHELRTPLQSILGFSELGMVRGREQPKLVMMFSDINASGQRMLALVNDLLDVSKIESAVGTFDLERCDLRHLIDTVQQELDPLLARRSLSLSSQLSTEPLVASVDPLRFQQVIRNVLANAIKFSPEGGQIDVNAQVTPTHEIHIAVADRGPGIPPDEVDKIFEAFVQSTGTKNGAGGTGLGLAISRKILDIHGGRIHAENRHGGGACFHIYLPGRTSGEASPPSA